MLCSWIAAPETFLRSMRIIWFFGSWSFSLFWVHDAETVFTLLELKFYRKVGNKKLIWTVRPIEHWKARGMVTADWGRREKLWVSKNDDVCKRNARNTITALGGPGSAGGSVLFRWMTATIKSVRIWEATTILLTVNCKWIAI